MPKFFLPKGKTPMDNIHSLEVRSMIEESEFEFQSSFFTTSFNISELSYEEKWEIYRLGHKLFRTKSGDGTLRKYKETRALTADFNREGTPDNNPSSYTIELGKDGTGDGKFLEFLRAVNTHLPPNGITNYEKSFHIYIGREMDRGDFNIVIVPAFSEEQATPNSARDHAKDIEWRAFPTENDFFAYIIKKGENRISRKRQECADIIKIKDTIPSPGFPTQVVFYTFDAFKVFQEGLKDSADELFVEFGRDKHMCTLILTFMKDDNPINCIIIDPTVGRVEAEGMCFDKGDLIPPPDDQAKWDSSFAPH